MSFYISILQKGREVWIISKYIYLYIYTYTSTKREKEREKMIMGSLTTEGKVRGMGGEESAEF